MSSWNLLDEKEEAELHKSRLLNVEEKPFKRITKRLQTLNALAISAIRQAPTPPPESNGNGTANSDADGSPSPGANAEALVQLREDITLDFAAFDSSIARLQFLLTANARERERYEADRGRIQDTSQRVKDNTSVLRTRLEGARATLEQRKKFDELAERITSNKLLRTRAEQGAALAKLEEECKSLEAESEEYTTTWRERREQFEKIMEESMRLRRQIRDEKEEVERREGMDDDGQGGGGDGDGDGAGQTPRPGLASGNATPRPDSGAIAAKVTGLESGDVGGTPRPASTAGGRTPARDGSVGPSGDSQMSLKVRPDHAGTFSRSGSRGPSREASPRLSVETRAAEAGEDVEMDDATKEREESPDSPLSSVPDVPDEPQDDDNSQDTPRIVVGGDDEASDKMDTT